VKKNILKDTIFASQFVQNKRVLDIACGVGYGSQILAQNDPIEIIGCDLLEDKIEYAKKYYTHKKIIF
jgi:2-polyprenyl-3-methyl-5-hydroxy-6-metoxy-1,4-benzoquinol methylase